ncbi:putative nuclease HARBI1 [Sitophilus oryzae]|uniref:Putative nuclease HARBI1 n=1 Tax=Sitophilus oryzae TaxID=7048 RepID=A0A6J2XHS6_SITOR|nr:putative nuclease HARBI1 [Sitophilus oryzae]
MANIVHLRTRKYYKPRHTSRESDFKTLFTFEEQNVMWLADHFLGADLETRGAALSPVQKVFLRYCANPEFQSGIADELGCTQPTVSRIYHEVLEQLVQPVGEWIRFPNTENQIMQAKEKWLTRFHFPTAIEVIYCMYIRILKPAQFGDEYIHRKGFSSINVQATCDQNCVITSRDASWPGSVHDSRIWKNSAVCEVMNRTRNTILLGDSGYGIMSCLMTPYSNPLQEYQIAFRLLKSERVVIEHIFGQLKRRFPILKYGCRVKFTSIPKVIIVSLHLLLYLSKAFPCKEKVEIINTNCSKTFYFYLLLLPFT